MGIDIKAVFGFGVLLQPNQLLWYEEEFDEFDCDYLEWISQQIHQLPLGEIFNASPEERKRFANTIPVTFIEAGNSKEHYLMLTKFYWLLEQPKPMNVDLNLDEFDSELAKAKEFCKRIGINFEHSTGWLLGILFD